MPLIIWLPLGAFTPVDRKGACREGREGGGGNGR